MSYKIGIDVGGTNTDAVLLDNRNNLLGGIKTPTTEDIGTGIFNAIDEVMSQANVDPAKVDYTMLGTTACTNALVERKSLARIGLIRISRPAASSINPMFTWPEDLREVVGDLYFEIQGGYEYDGTLISKDLDDYEVDEVIRKLKSECVEAVAICGIFSPVRSDQEKQLAKRLQAALGPEVPITMSHEIGSIGLLERENSAGLNAALVKVAAKAAGGLEKALIERGMSPRILFAQNDGTLMDLEYVRRFPILTIGSGPTNSIRGAAFLSGLDDCLVVDVGGTTTDVGVLTKGFPRTSGIAVEIGGVRTNFRMPDILAVGLGGGSVVRLENGAVKIGPDSVGYQLLEKGIGFGGDTLTTTDIIARMDPEKINHPAFLVERTSHIPDTVVSQVSQQIREITEASIDKMKTSNVDLPAVLVGGGSILMPDKLAGTSEVIRPLHYQYANAIGAAIAQVSGEVDRMWSLEKTTRAQAVEEAKATAIRMAMNAGAEANSVSIVDFEEVPLAYLSNHALRIRAKAAGILSS
ncbi:hydantoinase/oxoprolinase N-terminal domain-containing protein [Alkalihalobacterium alkalinitrilicum]|uniref:hydantoinase/oxoprolinase N-terminal domain-containing protein n=1 Tax=Alkalihalobacterium alkalinitrilicum TaxID=427920 RepID=UPI0009952B21|nr:hydantoinase/oxoprolinase family protein [Alkalihalobacterium alkalinitrilicum]